MREFQEGPFKKLEACKKARIQRVERYEEREGQVKRK